MLTKRIIPCLDVKAGRVVKGTNFVGLRDAGDPVELAKRYDLERADELVFLDITASHEGRGTMVEVAKSCAAQVFIPFTVGGGIRTVEDMRVMLAWRRARIKFQSTARRLKILSSLKTAQKNSAVNALCLQSTPNAPIMAGKFM